VVDGVRVYEWIDAVPIERRPADRRDLRDVAGALARIHGLNWPAEGRPDPWYSEPIGAERWAAALGGAADAGMAWAPQLQARLPELLALDEIVAAAPERPLIRCHLDYNRSNLARAADSGDILVFDWDNSGPGVAQREAAGALLDWATGPDRLADADAVREFIDAYGDFDAPDITVFAVRVAGWTHYLEMVCRRVAEATAAEDHRRFWADDVEAMLERPLSIANLEAMLTAVAGAVGT
nr:aminoglycoside phosphotransferase family protein [Actinomycetota bacterium]